MSDFKDNLINDTNYFFEGDYETIQGRIVPSVDDVAFGRYGKEVELAMLFIDVKESTKIVDAFRLKTAARMYQSFLRGVALIALKNDGEVRSFNGDGALIFFESSRFDSYNNAVKTAMEIKYILANENSEVKTTINKFTEIDFGIGIAHGEILCTKVGIGGDGHNKDLVWIGNAVNKSSKLADIARSPHNIIISESVYNNLKDENKYLGFNNKLAFGIPMIKIDMWEMRLFEYNGSNKNVYITSHSLEP